MTTIFSKTARERHLGNCGYLKRSMKIVSSASSGCGSPVSSENTHKDEVTRLCHLSSAHDREQTSKLCYPSSSFVTRRSRNPTRWKESMRPPARFAFGSLLRKGILRTLGPSGRNSTTLKDWLVSSGQTRNKNTHRIQSRRLFFFKNFLVRYLRYRLESGMLEVTVTLTFPERGQNCEHISPNSGSPSRVTLMLSPS